MLMSHHARLHLLLVGALLLLIAAAAVGQAASELDADCTTHDLGALAEPLELRAELSDDDCADPHDPQDVADLLSFTLQQTATVSLSMQARQFHAHLQLLGESGDVIAASRSRALGDRTILERTIDPGAYRIVASEHTRGRLTGGYLLNIRVVLRSAPDSDEPPLFVYPETDPSYDEPPDWLQYGRYVGTRCSADRSEVLKRDAIAVLLFNHQTTLWDNLLLPATHLNHSYNCHGADPHIKWTGYEGGHSGWDVQTYHVIGARTHDDVFYSLTNGTIAHIDWGYGAIVVHTDDGHTVYYQHVRHFYRWSGSDVQVGDALGVQGNEGMGVDDHTTFEHVHIAVREGFHLMPPPSGAVETIDPVPYFYRYLFE